MRIITREDRAGNGPYFNPFLTKSRRSIAHSTVLMDCFFLPFSKIVLYYFSRIFSDVFQGIKRGERIEIYTLRDLDSFVIINIYS